MSLRRFQVTEHSMVPTLLPGEEFIANTEASVGKGDIVATPHPQRPDFWLVKRVAGLEGDDIEFDGDRRMLESGEAWLLSDNATGGAVDSRTFGPVDVSTLWPVMTRIDAGNFPAAVSMLGSEDEALAAVVDEFGPPLFWERPPGFQTLTILILEQQVSLESAASVFRRLKEVAGAVTPTTIDALPPETLTSAGLTRQKSSYIKELAQKMVEGQFDLDRVSRLRRDAALAHLQILRGVGRWTAEAYLLSADGRPDIFPLGDRALQVGTGEVLGMASTPDPIDLEILAEPWKPIRSVAARLIWHAYLSRRGRVEPSH